MTFGAALALRKEGLTRPRWPRQALFRKYQKKILDLCMKVLFVDSDDSHGEAILRPL
jgi:hypothetical protein